MKISKTHFIFLVFVCFFVSCASVSKKQTSFYDIEIQKFSSEIKLLLNDLDFLKSEVLKVNAKRPSIQRILLEADDYWRKGNLNQTNSVLERGLRIAKDESALYLRFAHLRIEQGLDKEASAFASRGLFNKDASAWELLLLKIYSEEN
ncbi:MAG TPA: hypothetical protein EYO81_05725 [Gammaproteobacteria bacterium]|mgnify:FL=1|jgi:hypothetical protein|nr:hypothetical protein [Gammaproteobacteria bacterium]